MRIVVSGTHASGKSTLVADLASALSDHQVLPDPFEELDEMSEEPDAGTFSVQLRIAADRLHLAPTEKIIAERGPVDFLAYLDALLRLRRPNCRSPEPGEPSCC